LLLAQWPRRRAQVAAAGVSRGVAAAGVSRGVGTAALAARARCAYG